MKVLILLVSFLNFHLVRNHVYKRTILDFGQDAGSYIDMGTVNFTDLQEGFSVCSWVRRWSDHFSDYQFWVSYVGSTYEKDEVVISDAGYHSLMGWDSINPHIDSRTIGSWNHMCLTCNFTAGRRGFFYNGRRVYEGPPEGERKFETTGVLRFGKKNWHEVSSLNYFGGELFDTNFFSTELSDDQIRRLYNEGGCSDYSKTFTDKTVLSWEDIVSHERTGNVTEVYFECERDGPTEEATEESTEDSGVWDFLRNKEFYNLLISEEMISRFELLEEFLGHRIDDALIEHLVKHHSDTAYMAPLRHSIHGTSPNPRA